MQASVIYYRSMTFFSLKKFCHCYLETRLCLQKKQFHVIPINSCYPCRSVLESSTQFKDCFSRLSLAALFKKSLKINVSPRRQLQQIALDMISSDDFSHNLSFYDQKNFPLEIHLSSLVDYQFRKLFVLKGSIFFFSV